MPRKKKTDEEVIKQVSKLIAEETLQETEVKKAKTKIKEIWPKVTVGSHSIRTEYEDGRVDFVTDWEALKRDVHNALTEYESSAKVIKNKPLRIKNPKK